MQGGTDSLNSQAKDSIIDSASEDNGDKFRLTSRSDLDMHSMQREKNERSMGDLQESVIMAADGQDEETGMPKMQVEQNFEYKEEIQFRGEQVDNNTQKKAFNEVNKNKEDMTKESMKAQLLAHDQNK